MREQPMDAQEFDDVVRRFEEAWAAGATPEIAAFLPPDDAASTRRLELLTELVAIDLEFRWRKAPAAALRLEAYAARWPELLVDGVLPVELVAEEYRALRRRGEPPSADEYARRFPGCAEVHRALRQIEEELRREWGAGLPASGVGTAAARTPRLPPPFDPRAPLSHQDYKLLAFLGAGGMGKVYRAAQRSLDKAVAIKVLRKAYREQSEVVERFLEEARLVARLRHPGIIDVHGIGRMWNGAPFIVMDLAAGGDLATAAKTPVSVPQAIGWTIEAAEAVQHAHERGVIHCDLKPANLLLDEGRVRVTDFGLARPLHAVGRERMLLAGTVGFMAPEQADPGGGALDVRTDVYGLGGTLYALLVGRPPHIGRRTADVLVELLRGVRPTPLATLRPDVPVVVAAIVERCLAPDPADRFFSAREFSQALRAAMEGSSTRS